MKHSINHDKITASKSNHKPSDVSKRVVLVLGTHGAVIGIKLVTVLSQTSDEYEAELVVPARTMTFKTTALAVCIIHRSKYDH